MKQNKKFLKLLILAVAAAELTLGFAVPAYAQNAATSTKKVNPTPAKPATTAAPAPKANPNEKQISTAKSGAQKTIETLLCHPTENLTGHTASFSDLNPVSGGGSVLDPLGGNDTVNNVANNDLFNCVNKMFKFGIAIGSVGGVMFFVIAGYLYVTGGEESITEAKAMMGSTVAGVVVLVIVYIFLVTINPDLIQIKVLQLPVLVHLDTSLCDPAKPTDEQGKPTAACVTQISFTGAARPGEPSGDTNDGGPGANVAAHHKFAELVPPCGFQATIDKNDAAVGNMTELLFQDVKTICQNVLTTTKKNPAISYITGGKHATNSRHYRGCATDFGDDPSSETGKRIIAEALKLGMVVNPGSDAHQDNHVHVDIAKGCKSGALQK